MELIGWSWKLVVGVFVVGDYIGVFVDWCCLINVCFVWRVLVIVSFLFLGVRRMFLGCVFFVCFFCYRFSFGKFLG